MDLLLKDNSFPINVRIDVIDEFSLKRNDDEAGHINIHLPVDMQC